MLRRFSIFGTAALAVAGLIGAAAAPARAQTDVTGAGVRPALSSASTYGYPAYTWGYYYAPAYARAYYYPAYGYSYYYYPYSTTYVTTPAVAYTAAVPAPAVAYTPGYYATPGSYYSAYYNPNTDLSNPGAAVSAVGPMANGNCAHLLVVVPPDANVWFNGIPTEQRGVERPFVSPPLTPGKDYTYDLAARWIAPNGHAVEKTKSIHVRANGRSMVDFTQPAVGRAEPAAPAPAPSAGAPSKR
jgi:uncharacterized protein (TIGR03000 family)